MSKRISVALTTYNGERFLREQLDSLYSQTLVPDEIVVCDDCSSDGTISILDEYRLSKGLKYYVNDKQLGVNGNFFKAISLCSGDYIALCDQDDIWLPLKIEKCYNKIIEIEDNGKALVFSERNDIDSAGNAIRIKKTKSDYYGYSRTLLDSIDYCQGCSLMLNRPLVDYVLDKYYASPFNHKVILYDAFIAYCGVMIGNKCDIGEPLLLYRHHDRNVIGKIGRKMSFKDHLAVQGRYRGFMPDVRFDAIRKVYNIVKSDVKNKEIHDLVKKIELIDNSSSIFRGLCIIININELSVFSKIRIVFGTILVSALKKIFNI